MDTTDKPLLPGRLSFVPTVDAGARLDEHRSRNPPRRSRALAGMGARGALGRGTVGGLVGLPLYARQAFFCCGSILLFGMSLTAVTVWSLAGRYSRNRSRENAQVGHARPAVLPDEPWTIGDEPLWERRERAVRRRERRVWVRTALLLVPALITVGAWATVNMWERGDRPLTPDDVGNLVLIGLIGVGCVAIAVAQTRAAIHRRPIEPDRLVSEQSALRARFLAPGSAPEVERAAANMALATGCDVPMLYVAKTPSANAFLFTDGSMAVTSGLIGLLDRGEFAPVFAWLFVRRSEPDVIETTDIALAPEEAEWTDAEAFRIAADPAHMLRAWKKIMNAENRVPGSERLPDANFLVRPGERAEWRGRRIAQVTTLAGAMGADGTDTTSEARS